MTSVRPFVEKMSGLGWVVVCWQASVVEQSWVTPFWGWSFGVGLITWTIFYAPEESSIFSTFSGKHFPLGFWVAEREPGWCRHWERVLTLTHTHLASAHMMSICWSWNSRGGLHRTSTPPKASSHRFLNTCPHLTHKRSWATCWTCWDIGMSSWRESLLWESWCWGRGVTPGLSPERNRCCEGLTGKDWGSRFLSN